MRPRPVSPLPSADLCARVALTCAGLSGNHHIGHAIRTTGSAVDVVSDLWDDIPSTIPDDIRAHARTLGTPAVVASVLENTARLGLQILTPRHRNWPAGFHDLGCSAPLLLWTSGDPALLDQPAIVVTGTTRPTPELRHLAIEITTRLADELWTLAATTRHGVDQLTRTAAIAMGGTVVTTAPTARPAANSRELVISENPPTMPIVLASSVRTPVLLAALGDRVVLADPTPGTGAHRTGVAAHALARPLGLLGEVGTPTGGHERTHFDATPVRTLEEVERLV